MLGTFAGPGLTDDEEATLARWRAARERRRAEEGHGPSEAASEDDGAVGVPKVGGWDG